MKKIRRIWNEIPKPYRFCMNLTVILLLLFALYTFISAPPFTTEVQYRRVEKAHFVGPAEILGMEAQNFCAYDRILMAEDEHGVILYAESTDRQYEPELIYRERTGNVMILTAPNSNTYNSTDTQYQLTLVAFDNCPEATRAELSLTVSADLSGGYFQKSYSMEAQRNNPGYFCFLLQVFNLRGLGQEGYALQLLSRITGYVGRYYMDTAIPATIRFYDDQGNLIGQESVSLRCVEAEAHAEQGE